MDMDFSQLQITQLIPQRPPFVMVDKVLSCDLTDAVTELYVSEDNIFLDDMKLSPAGIIENMAQSCAARMGCINLMNNDSVKIGFIGDIRNCEIIRQPIFNETITTYVHIVVDVMQLTLAEVTAKVGDEIVATARIKVGLIDKEPTD